MGLGGLLVVGVWRGDRWIDRTICVNVLIQCKELFRSTFLDFAPIACDAHPALCAPESFGIDIKTIVLFRRIQSNTEDATKILCKLPVDIGASDAQI